MVSSVSLQIRARWCTPLTVLTGRCASGRRYFLRSSSRRARTRASSSPSGSGITDSFARSPAAAAWQLELQSLPALRACGAQADLFWLQAAPEPPAPQAAQVLRQPRRRHRQHRAGRVAQAVPADPAAEQPPHDAVTPGPDNEDVIRLRRDLGEDLAGVTPNDDRAELDVGGGTADGHVDRLEQAVPGSLPPQAPKLRVRTPPLGEVTTGRRPGKHKGQCPCFLAG